MTWVARVADTVRLTPLAESVLDAYGGADLWQASRAVHAVLSAGGLAFAMKRNGALDHLALEVDLHEPHIRLSPFGKQGGTAVLESGTVRIEDPAGRIVSSRDNPRRFFPYGRRLFYWDELDLAYFCGYAAWNYLAFPRLLLRPDIVWRQLTPDTLEAEFPADCPTHSRLQRFHFDPATHLLRQHDYTAQVMGSWARAANVVQNHATWHGMRYASTRRVTPRLPNGRPAWGPVLVWIEVSEWRIG